MISLKEFHENTDMKDNVHNYLVEYLEKEAVKRVFEREDTTAIADAKEVIDKAFEHLEVLFAPKSQGKEVINEAR